MRLLILNSILFFLKNNNNNNKKQQKANKKPNTFERETERERGKRESLSNRQYFVCLLTSINDPGKQIYTFGIENGGFCAGIIDTNSKITAIS